ncbi:homeobox protein MSX-2 [Lucilia cuprina]|uniref:homeobox protein MSX-2 n=1 Tax=Lucilia cuprina TaxID=7375 RepID=UPI001F05D00F|nr:homeobox protein MSX-2 [Lucilia cuprina]
MSDFSIDYILNRAGEKYEGTNRSLGIIKRNNKIPQFHPFMMVINDHENKLEFLKQLQQHHHQQQQQQDHHQQQCLDEMPVLDWLQYSRYHPPKLPRSLRQGPAKRTPGRLPRIPFTPAQLQTLENAYKNSNYLSAEDANKLAESLDLTNTRVKIWFQNRRARERREKREKEESYDSTLSSNASTPEPEDVIDIE